jgi:hypothetical protein
MGALLDEMGDPVRKRLGLAGTRPRDNQQWSTRAILRGAGLVGVEGWRHGFELRSIPKLELITIRSSSLCRTVEHIIQKADIPIAWVNALKLLE